MSSCHSLNGYLPLRVDAQQPARALADVEPARPGFCRAALACGEGGGERLLIQSQGSLTFGASIFDVGSGVFVVQERLRRSTGGALIPVA